MDDFELERDLEDAGIDAFDFSLMDEDERREALEDAFLDPDMYMDADLSSSFHAWEQLQSAGLNLSDLDYLDEDERREKIESAGLDPDDYDDGSSYFFHSAPVSSPPVQSSPAPRTAPVKKEDAPVPPEPREVFRYLLVRFSSSGKSYAYRTDDRTVSAGAQVMVPVGEDNAPVLAQVISAGDYAAEVAPYPPEKTKPILRKATADDLATHKQPKPAEKPAAPAVSRSTQAPASPPEEAHIKEEALKEAEPSRENNTRKRKVLIAVIVILSVIALVLLGIVMSNLSAIREEYELWQEKKILEQMEQNRQYFLSAAENYEADVVEDIYKELNSKYRHQSLREFTDDYTIHIESEIVESTWKETVYVDVAAEELFDEYNDASKVASLYDYSVDPLNELRYSPPSNLSSLARNNGYERSVLCHVTITTAENTYEYERGDGVKSGFDYFYLNGERHDVILEPRSTPAVTTPRSSIPYEGEYVTSSMTRNWTVLLSDYSYRYRSGIHKGERVSSTQYKYVNGGYTYYIFVDNKTHKVIEVNKQSNSTPKSTPKPTTRPTTSNNDPYNAKDYAHPDDFYYDYYDDFWDYEDAEEYWEEYGDW